jgi:hypothetical protein
MQVLFHPGSSGNKEEYLLFESNDEDNPIVRVPLNGEGLAPRIEVDPLFYDYGSPLVGCPEELITSIKNIGTTNLTIDRVTFSGNTDIIFNLSESDYGKPPWTVFPGEEILSYEVYEADNEVFDISYITVDSNDPTNPVVIASREGDAVRAGTITDSFIQEETEQVDILFVVDNSGSMSSEQTELSTNAITFITTLEASGAEYNLAVITTDDSSFRGPVLYSGYPDIVNEFEYQLVAGTSGDATERGLEMAYLSTLSGGDAEPGGIFQRESAVLSIVFVSDEDDFSAQVVSYYVSHFQSLKANPDKVILHAVADDPYDATSCGSGAAYRYYDAVSATGGIFSSICTSTWAVDLETIAAGSLIPNLDFPLSEDPIIESIEVWVNGSLITIGWSYDIVENLIIFEEDAAPVAGDVVEIIYGYYGECP